MSWPLESEKDLYRQLTLLEGVHAAKMNCLILGSHRVKHAESASRRENEQASRNPAAYISEIRRLKSFDLGAMDLICAECGAKHWKAELPAQLPAKCNPANMFWMSCCKAGAVKVDGVQEPPEFLKTLLEENDAKGRHFRENIRQYNAAFAFTSLRCEVENRNMSFMPFQIHGEMYHMQGPLMAENDNTAKYAQLYIYDPQYASSIRASNNSDLNEEIINGLSSMLHEKNPHVQLYKTAHELLMNTESNSSEVPFVRICPSITIELVAGSDRRTENLPTSDEVAGIIPYERTAEGFRDIRIYLRNVEGVHSHTSISQNHALYMPLHYTLLFPMGGLGWHWGLTLADGSTRLNQRPYYRYRLHQRANEYPSLFLAKRLFQQYLVDVWAICDQNKLDWIRSHQSNLRADLYNGLQDVLISEDVDAASLGRRFILPSSYTGGPRFMAKLYQDSMAIVRHFGKPSLFITFTANPRWIEIQRELLPGQHASDRPDLVARVFDLKVKELLKDLKVKKVFGSYRGLVRTIEYQKRGLPHLHLLLFLDATHNIDTSTKVDHIISAEIPSKESDPELYEIITKNMVHGPCGSLNPKSPCMAKNAHGLLICTKRFPKAHSEETIVTENGYPIYKRSATVNPADIYTVPDPRMAGSNRIRIPIDNGWIVPYNPFLSKKYKAHINVECCQGVQAIKYINKYIYKGSDRTTLRLSDTNDEIARHLQGRYIGPTEAFGRLFEYKVHDEDPTVTCLALHLPNEQPVYFPEDASAPQIQRILQTSTSMLIAYFKHYEENPTAEKHLYQDFPRHFVWQLKEKVWTARKRGFAIGRIPYYTPTCGERYYLRLLLVNVAGSKSFDDIKTINGHQSETFKQACLQLHLIDDDREWIRCFKEASLFSSGSSLRNLFVTALTFVQLTDPVSLWAAFRDSMCDDLDHKLNRLFPGNQLYTSTDDTAFYDGQPSHDYGLYLIETTLNELSKSLGDFNLLLFKHNWTEALNQSTGSGRTDNSLVDEQLTYDTQEEEAAYSSKYALFNLDQKHAFDRIVEKLQSHESASDVNPTHSENGICFFLHGPAGTGKTFVYNTLCNYWRSKRKIVLCVASSGIASLLLSGGTTSHFRLKIPLKVNETSTCSITKNSKLAELLRMTTLLIWDEVPMQNKSCFETVDRTLRDIRSSNVLFGGLPVVLGGDFAQIPPVVKNGNRSSIVEASIKQSYIWGHTEVVQLKQNMRVRGTSVNDLHFKEWLTSITYNTALQNAKILLPQYISQTYSIDELISKVYP
ncbi:hypothetical protein [Absidia glauca]|uniref:ATP-dependent DNA helicase n=1 Tax=Absidia glauca TaxID=4829 RepID=A0A163KNR7_ABSGL|nr:hypothetical protein [Absidia glauca]